MSAKEGDVLPALDTPEFPEPIYLDETADILQAKKADIILFNQQLRTLHFLWSQVRSVKTALNMMRMTTELIEKRRHILGLEYGAASNKTSRLTVFEPVD